MNRYSHALFFSLSPTHVLKLAYTHGVVKKFTVMCDYLLVTLDGTHYHSSKKIKCDCCQTRTNKETGDIHYLHSAITPAIVHPDIKKVLPLMQEFISNTDGENKQDCEVNAAKRWLEKYKVLNGFKIIVMGDDLYSSEPMMQAVVDKGHS